MNNNTAAEFRDLREKSGLSVAALSRMIKTSESSIKRYERGEREIPDEVMESVTIISQSVTADSIKRAGERIKSYKKNRLGDFDLETAREIAPEDFVDPEAV